MSTLSWLLELPEAGTITRLADEAEALERRREALLAQLKVLDGFMATLRVQAEEEALRGWSRKEVAAAKKAAKLAQRK